jgi:hypothetical protein
MLNLNKSVQILLDNKKITNISFNENEMNSFGYESLNEVFFDVFEIKGKNLQFIKEKRGDLNGEPIVELDLCIENQKYKNVRFVLKKNGNININPKLLDHLSATVFEQSNKNKLHPVIISEKHTKPASRPASRPASKNIKVLEESKILSETKIIETVKEDFFNTIKQNIITSLKEEIKAGIIADMLKENLQNNFDNFINQNDKSNKLYKLFEQTNNSFRKELMELIEKISKREALRYAESGGGTNAIQYANGGVMDGNLIVTGNFECDSITIKNNNNPAIKKFVSIFGDGVNSNYTITHDLSVRDVVVSIVDSNTQEVVYPLVINTNINEITVEFSQAPSLSAYKAIIIG